MKRRSVEPVGWRIATDRRTRARVAVGVRTPWQTRQDVGLMVWNPVAEAVDDRLPSAVQWAVHEQAGRSGEARSGERHG